MKKLFLIALIFLLVSCSAEQSAPPSEFDARVLLQTHGAEYGALYEKRESSDRLVICSPEELSGMEFSLADGVCTAKMGDISFEAEQLAHVFDFLPVSGECEKTVGERVYKIYDLRGVE